MFIQLHRVTDFANPETDQLTVVNTDHIIFVDAMTRDDRVCSLLRLSTGDTQTVSEPPAVVIHLIWVATTQPDPMSNPLRSEGVPSHQQMWWQNPVICKTGDSSTASTIKDVG